MDHNTHNIFRLEDPRGVAGAGVQLRPTALCVGEQGGSTFLGRVFRRPSLSLQVAAFNTYLHKSTDIYFTLHIFTRIK